MLLFGLRFYRERAQRPGLRADRVALPDDGRRADSRDPPGETPVVLHLLRVAVLRAPVRGGFWRLNRSAGRFWRGRLPPRGARRIGYHIQAAPRSDSCEIEPAAGALGAARRTAHSLARAVERHRLNRRGPDRGRRLPGGGGGRACGPPPSAGVCVARGLVDDGDPDEAGRGVPGQALPLFAEAAVEGVDFPSSGPSTCRGDALVACCRR